MAKQNKKLFVKATRSNVHEISPDGQFITGHGQPRRTVGKLYNNTTGNWDIIPEGVYIHYHPEYIKHLKERSLLPVDIETAILAGVTWESLENN